MPNDKDKPRQYSEILAEFMRESRKLSLSYSRFVDLSDREIYEWSKNPQNKQALQDQLEKVKSLFQELDQAYKHLIEKTN